MSTITELRHDFHVSDHGSVIVLSPLTTIAHDWTNDHLPTDCPQWLDGFVIECSFINAIMEGLVSDGMSFSVV